MKFSIHPLQMSVDAITTALLTQLFRRYERVEVASGTPRLTELELMEMLPSMKNQFFRLTEINGGVAITHVRKRRSKSDPYLPASIRVIPISGL